jgi:hypothetical protein
LNASRIDDGATSCEDSAPHERAYSRGNVGGESDDRAPIDNGVRSKSRDAEVVVDRARTVVYSLCSIQQLSLTIGSTSVLARSSPVARARTTVPAAWKERHRDTLANDQVGHAVAELLDDTCRLVSEQKRNGTRANARNDREIRVTDTCRLNSDEDFIRPWFVEIEVLDDYWASQCERALRAKGFEDRSSDFHVVS